MAKAIFLDRDGVITKLVFNKKTNELEPPHNLKDFCVLPKVFEALKNIMKKKYLLFLISNQPDYAKGKTSLSKLKKIHLKLDEELKKNQIFFQKYYYCYHHPKGRVEEYTKKCECRKPSPYFVEQAIKEYNIDKENSWFIGDRSTDIECGKNAQIKTILINGEYAQFKNVTSEIKPNYYASDLSEAVEIIVGEQALVGLRRQETGDRSQEKKTGFKGQSPLDC